MERIGIDVGAPKASVRGVDAAVWKGPDAWSRTEPGPWDGTGGYLPASGGGPEGGGRSLGKRRTVCHENRPGDGARAMAAHAARPWHGALGASGIVFSGTGRRTSGLPGSTRHSSRVPWPKKSWGRRCVRRFRRSCLPVSRCCKPIYRPGPAPHPNPA